MGPIHPGDDAHIPSAEGFMADFSIAVRDDKCHGPFGTCPDSKLPSILETHEEELAAERYTDTLLKKDMKGGGKKGKNGQ